MMFEISFKIALAHSELLTYVWSKILFTKNKTYENKMNTKFDQENPEKWKKIVEKV